MAVEDKYVNTTFRTGELIDAKVNGSNYPIVYVESEEIAAADDDGSVYRFSLPIQSNDVILSLEISNDAITGGTDYDIGLYDINSGSVVDADLFADGISVASAGDKTNALTAPDIADLAKPVWELLSLSSDPKKEYDLAVTANTVGTAAGTITLHVTKTN